PTVTWRCQVLKLRFSTLIISVAQLTTTAARYILVLTDSFISLWARMLTPLILSRLVTCWERFSESIPTVQFLLTIQRLFQESPVLLPATTGRSGVLGFETRTHSISNPAQAGCSLMTSAKT